MQVTAISSAYTGAQKQMQNNLANGKHAGGSTFDDILKSVSGGAAMKMTEEEIEQALERAMARMEILLGSEVAESIINDDGSVNIVRFTQVMNAAERPYANGNRATAANAPQVVDMIA